MPTDWGESIFLAISTAAGVLAVGALTVHSESATAKPGGAPKTGVGAVFMVNPVQSSGNQGLTDQKDAARAVPGSQVSRLSSLGIDRVLKKLRRIGNGRNVGMAP